ncbi:vitellogenin-3-like [Condylostylus longicornis]|uniref:vitellogenin-3-like n=1 Tax=Condylostylus longicornis TaxID=2530218 RepID=UPI00244E4747|nr:vitellogenin-3-like [Condylostylus longicornis]XP_055370781.1 vitellogenin-3-like [Condylostylus longicornis]XP_055370782.1 vitellogenin-3-like [Condylostylus longicornis]
MRLNIFKFFVFIGLIGLSFSYPQLYSLRGVFDTATNVTGGILKKVPKYIPSVSEVWTLGKDVIAGYPFEIASELINKVCSGVNAIEAVQSQVTPDVNSMTLRLITECQNYTFPILKASEMWKSPHFDPSKKVVVIISGWTNTINESSTIYEIGKAYLCRGGVNVVALDAGQYVNTLYTWSALNVDEIGKILASGLVELEKVVPLENIHLIGHSLGANIAGYAGKYFTSTTDRLLPRITALDPARPCFNEGEKLSGIERGDAEFIDVIHSNSGVLGKRVPVGDVDFYPGGTGPLRKGCFSIVCSHSRAFEYYAETVYPGYENNLMAVRCNSLANLKRGFCTGRPHTMGYGVSTKLKGSYFSDPDGVFPFGLPDNHEKPDVTQCGLCHSEEAKKPLVKF